MSQILTAQQLSLPNLAYLACVFDEKITSLRLTSLPSPLLNDHTFFLPKSLKSVEIHISRFCTTFTSCQSFIDAIPTGSKIQSFDFKSDHYDHHFKLNRLKKCSNLTHLRLTLLPAFLPRFKQLRSLRSLVLTRPTLTNITIAEYESLAIRALAASPPYLTQLSFVEWLPQLSDSWSTLAASPLMHLTELTVTRYGGSITSLDVLVPFQRLTHLSFIIVTTGLCNQIRQFLSYPNVIPSLTFLFLHSNADGSHPGVTWKWQLNPPPDETNSDQNFRRPTGHRPTTTNDTPGFPPASRLVGIETNPGPVATNTTSSSNFQLNRVKSTFMNAMVQPCLVNLCAYFTLTERIRNQSVSRAWLSVIRLSCWWRDLQFDYDLSQISDSSPCLPWLCPLLGGIHLQLSRRVIPLAQLLRPWTHIHHLELSDFWEADLLQKARPSLSLEEARSGLKQLRLTSFVWLVWQGAMFTPQVLFATPAEMNAPPRTDGVPPAGALFAWHKTLECFTAEYEGDGHGIINLMLGMALVQWPELKDIQFSQQKSNVAKRLSAPHMRGVKQFLSCQTIPQLRRFQLILTVNGDSLQELTDVVQEAFLSTPFTHSLTELDLCIGTPIIHPDVPGVPYGHFYDPDKKSMKYILVGAPPIQYCFNTLTRTSVTGFNSAWLKAISHCSELVNLSIETPILLDVNEYEFFDIISRLPITTLTMSYFTCSSDGSASAVDESLARGLRHSLLEMTLLTTLFITLRPDQQRSVGYRVHHNHWLSYLDCFVRLSRLECTIQLLQPAGSDMDWMYDESTYKIRIEPAKYPPQMLTAITNILSLESLTLSAVGETDLKILNDGWMERLNGRDLDSGQMKNPSPIILSQLTLHEINVTPDVGFRWLLQLATYLPQFPRLSDLSISLYNHLNASQSNQSDLNKFYELLSHCSHLRHLNLSGAGQVQPDVIRYWCSSDTQRGGPKFRFLERIEFDGKHYSDYDGTLPLFYSLPNLSEINGGYFNEAVQAHFTRTNADLTKLPYPRHPRIQLLTPMNPRPKTKVDRIIPIEGVRMERLMRHRFL